MTLTDKEIEYFREQLPKGVVLLDLRQVETIEDFTQQFCPAEHYDKTAEEQAVRAIEEIIRNGKTM